MLLTFAHQPWSDCPRPLSPEGSDYIIILRMNGKCKMENGKLNFPFSIYYFQFRQDASRVVSEEPASPSASGFLLIVRIRLHPSIVTVNGTKGCAGCSSI